MEIMMRIGSESWEILKDSAIFMLLGLFIAGLMKGLIPGSWIAKHLGQGQRFGVLKAALFGIPLPLCSCGVLPAAAALREQGAGKGETAAFLISTPETGVDSIAVTYSLLDPIMAVLRPIAAFITALLAGVSINALTRPDPDPIRVNFAPSTCADAACTCGFSTVKPPLADRLRQGLRFAFCDLLNDIGLWFLLGVLIAGTIAALMPQGFIERHLGSGLASMLLMLVISVPLYVCATASTPVAAALVLKGLSPGAAMVFLLAGPATNAAALTVIAKVIGQKATFIYLAVIVICSLGIGVAVNVLYEVMGFTVSSWSSHFESEAASLISAFAAFFLLCFIVAYRIISAFKRVKT